MVAIDDFESILEKDAAVVDSNHKDDEDLPAAVAAKRRIRYFDDEEENPTGGGPPGADMGPPLRRTNSTYSVHSLSSVRSGRRSINPAIVLPVQYRTLSYTISFQREQDAVQAKDAREKTAVGK